MSGDDTCGFLSFQITPSTKKWWICTAESTTALANGKVYPPITPICGNSQEEANATCEVHERPAHALPNREASRSGGCLRGRALAQLYHPGDEQVLERVEEGNELSKAGTRQPRTNHTYWVAVGKRTIGGSRRRLRRQKRAAKKRKAAPQAVAVGNEFVGLAARARP